MRRAWVIPLISASIWACGGGCGSSGGEDESTASTSGTAAGSGGGAGASGSGAGGGVHAITCDGAPADPALEGTWAAVGKLAVKLEGAPGGVITLCPTDQIGEASMLLLLSIKADAADAQKLAEVSASLCSIELPTVSALLGSCDPKSQGLVHTQIIAPEAFLAALPKVATPTVSGAVSGKGNGAPVAFERLTVALGASKGGDMLPRWDESGLACAGLSVGHTNACEMACVSDCAALRDDDGDSYPGVTLQVCGKTSSDEKSGVACHADNPDAPGATLQGKAFMDLQVDPRFTGTAKSSCEINGTIDAAVLYNIVGADVYLAGSNVSVNQAIKSLPAFKVDSAQSRFRMVRIDGKYGAPSFGVDPAAADAACATLRQRVNEL
jgi:hypothetical protein